MMSLKVLHAGDGYAYLTKQVASGDQVRKRGELLADYYTAHGMPAGQWWGKGAEELCVSGEVTEEQMQASFGEFLHPDANEKLEQLIADGATAEEALKSVQLGRKPFDFNRDIPFIQAMKQQTIDFTQANRRVPTREEAEGLEWIVAQRLLAQKPPSIEDTSSAITEANLAAETQLDPTPRTKMAEELSLAAPTLSGGTKQPVTSEGIKQFIAQEKSRARYPVSGYDMVFTPVKSISALWGIGDEQTRKAIMKAHSEAVESSLHWIEDNAIFTRSGTNGAQKIDCEGMTVAKYVHWDNRAGDPNLHTHCPVFNRVKSTTDGKYRTIDGQVLHRAAVSASEHYNQQITQRISEMLPVTFEPVEKSRGGRPVWEIKGIPDKVLSAMSRRDDVVARGRELIEEYRDKYGRSPNKATQYKIMEQANLETREAKSDLRSLEEMVTEWRDIANNLDDDFDLDSILTDVFAAPEWLDEPEPGAPRSEWDAWHRQEAKRRHDYTSANNDLIISRVMSAVERDRPTWTEYHLTSELSRQLNYYTFTDEKQRREVADRLLTQCVSGKSVAVDRHRDIPESLTRSNGESVYVSHASTRYTSTNVLNAESTVTEASNLWVVNEHSPASLDSHAAAFAAEKGYKLSKDKRAFVEHLLCSPATLAVGIGAAGSGKTTAMQIFARSWEDTGNKVIGLTPSATAAQSLSESLGIEASTLAKFVHPGAELPAEMKPKRGDVILIDEAGMAPTHDIAETVRKAKQVGAVVRMVGDPQQLASIESGGMLGALADMTDAPMLSEIHRFRDAAEARISLRLREGDTSVIDWYERHGRITTGLREHLPAEVFDAWLTARSNGKKALMIAGDRNTVDSLNSLARMHYIEAGSVNADGPEARIADGGVASIGDTIVTRENDGRLRYGHRGKHRVKNGDLWTISDITDKGDLLASHVGTGEKVTLPAEYAAENVELGYASTIYRSQGQTVDQAFVIPSAALDRQGLYVAMTRGKETNRIFLPDDQVPDIDSHIEQTQPMTPREFIETIIERDGAAITAHAALEAAESADYDVTTMRLAYTDLVEDMAVEIAVASTSDEQTATLLREDWQTRRLAEAIGHLDHAGVDTDAAMSTAVAAAKQRWDNAGPDNQGSLAFLVRMELENLDKTSQLADDDMVWALGAPLPPLRETDKRTGTLGDEELHDYVCSTYALLQEAADSAGDAAVDHGTTWIDQLPDAHPDDREYHAVWQRAVRAVAAVGLDDAVDMSDVRAIDNKELQRRIAALDSADRRRGTDPFEGLSKVELQRYIRHCDEECDKLGFTARIEDDALRQASLMPETTKARSEWDRTVDQAEKITAYRATEEASTLAQSEYKQAMDAYHAALGSGRIGRPRRVELAREELAVKQQALSEASAALRAVEHGLPPKHMWEQITALAANDAEWTQRMSHAAGQDDRALTTARSRVDRREAELLLWDERKHVAESLVEAMRPASRESVDYYLDRMRSELSGNREQRQRAAAAEGAADSSAEVPTPPRTPDTPDDGTPYNPRRQKKDKPDPRPGGWRERRDRLIEAGQIAPGSAGATPVVSTAVPKQSVDDVVNGVLSRVGATVPSSAATTMEQDTNPSAAPADTPDTTVKEGPEI